MSVLNTVLLICNALISAAMDTMASHPEDLREACNEIRAAETSRELQPNKSSSTPSKKLSEADPEDMNKKFLEALAKELSLTPEAIAKMFGDYHLNCTRRRANEREQILTLRSKNHFQSWNARERPFWHWQRPNDGS